jgi:hypothetical protein
MSGAFSEKDPYYRDGILAVLAQAVRDGPRMPRSPATDPGSTR